MLLGIFKCGLFIPQSQHGSQLAPRPRRVGPVKLLPGVGLHVVLWCMNSSSHWCVQSVCVLLRLPQTSVGSHHTLSLVLRRFVCGEQQITLAQFTFTVQVLYCFLFQNMEVRAWKIRNHACVMLVCTTTHGAYWLFSSPFYQPEFRLRFV